MLVTLNLIAFAYHTLAELTEDLWARARGKAGTRIACERRPPSIPHALDAVSFLAADVRNLFGPFINVFLVTGQHWTRTDVGLIATGSGLLGIALQTPIGAAIDVTRAKRAVIVATMAAMSAAALIIVLWPSFWPMALATCILALAGDAFVPAVSALTLGLVTREERARRVIGELGVAQLVEEASDIETSSPSARFAVEREVVRGEVGEDKRAVAAHIAVQSQS